MIGRTSPVRFESYAFLELVNCGSFGEIWKVATQLSGSETLSALKISYRPINSHEVQTALSSHELAVSANQRGLVSIRSIGEYYNRLTVVMELADCTLPNHLSKFTLEAIDRRRLLLQYIVEVSATADALLSKGFVHGAITPQEILLKDGHALLCDFTMLHPISVPIPPHATISLNTWTYMSPEVKNRKSGYFSDQYSIAMSYCAMRMGVLPMKAPECL